MDNETHDAELIVVATFRLEAEAELARGRLDEAGIESFVRSDNAGGMYPPMDAAALVVRAEDAARSAEILKV